MRAAGVSPADKEWINRHAEELRSIGAREFAQKGRGVIVVEVADRVAEGDFDYSYLPLKWFRESGPMRDLMQTYDPETEVCFALANDLTRPIQIVGWALIGSDTSGSS